MKDIVYELLNFFADLGYLGVALGLMIEIIPSEIVLGYGGYLVDLGQMNFIGAVIAGVIGGTIAQLFLYWAGYYGGRPFLEKYGKYILINKHHIDVAEQWFEKYGGGVVFGARFIPVVRHAISIPAGIAKMPIMKFIGYTLAAIIPWTIGFIYLGTVLGKNWSHIKEAASPYVTPLLFIAAICIIIYILWKRRKTPPVRTVRKK
ncbi:DedA family protein [Peribacillus kribbensis]|uniref:DedA family protein n=1 Tax=Peribacillus kribbensis TaxID=356658 RepID=UPI00040D2C4B|nr:DedA family protein [Peribacillus kribbensis]